MIDLSAIIVAMPDAALAAAARQLPDDALASMLRAQWLSWG